jgi:hypothetical protein
MGSKKIAERHRNCTQRITSGKPTLQCIRVSPTFIPKIIQNYGKKDVGYPII